MNPETGFYLGTHQPNWLTHVDAPLCVSHPRLAGRRALPRAIGPWVLDSGGFSELDLHGRWRTTARQYVTAVRRYRDEIGNLRWAAPRDRMCEPHILSKAGASVAQHQELTTADFLELRSLDADLPFIPVLQGWCRGDHLRHAARYERAGVDLAAYPVVGVGSVCRRQNTTSVYLIISQLARETGLPLHGFGVKTTGLHHYGAHLASADSLAWSYAGRYERGCSTSHRRESNCLRYALTWHSDLLAGLTHDLRAAQAAA